MDAAYVLSYEKWAQALHQQLQHCHLYLQKKSQILFTSAKTKIFFQYGIIVMTRAL